MESRFVDHVGAVGHTGDSVDVAGAEFAYFRQPGRGIMDDLDDQSGIGDRAGVESWLSWNRDDLGDQVDRLAGDVSVYRDLRSAKFVGTEQALFEDALARYGFAVIGAWISHGVMEQKCREKWQLRNLSELEGIKLTARDVEELTMDTVAAAVEGFRNNVLARGKWDPKKGAALRTFFIGQCEFQYPDVARRWKRQRRDLLTDSALDDAQLGRLTHSVLGNAEADVIQADSIAEHLSPVKRDDAKIALVMRSHQYSNSEIAQELGTTVKTVEGLLSVARKQIERAQEGTA